MRGVLLVISVLAVATAGGFWAGTAYAPCALPRR